MEGTVTKMISLLLTTRTDHETEEGINREEEKNVVSSRSLFCGLVGVFTPSYPVDVCLCVGGGGGGATYGNVS